MLLNKLTIVTFSQNMFGQLFSHILNSAVHHFFDCIEKRPVSAKLFCLWIRKLVVPLRKSNWEHVGASPSLPSGNIEYANVAFKSGRNPHIHITHTSIFIHITELRFDVSCTGIADLFWCGNEIAQSKECDSKFWAGSFNHPSPSLLQSRATVVIATLRFEYRSQC